MDGFMELLRLLHSWVRWAVVIVTVIAVVYFLLGLVQRREYGAQARRLMSIFTGVIGLQWLIGLIFLVVNGTGIEGYFSRGYVWEHVTTMTLALVAANAYHGWRRRDLPDNRRYLLNLLVIGVALVLVFVGVGRLPYEAWRFYTPS